MKGQIPSQATFSNRYIDAMIVKVKGGPVDYQSAVRAGAKFYGAEAQNQTRQKWHRLIRPLQNIGE